MQHAIHKKSEQNSIEAADGLATPIASQILHLCDNETAGDLFRLPDQFIPPSFTWSDDEVFSSTAAEAAKDTGASISTQFPCCAALDFATLFGSPSVLQHEPDAELIQAARCYSASYSSVKPDPLTMFPVMNPSDDKFSLDDPAESAFQQRWPSPVLVPLEVTWGLRRHQQSRAGSQWEMFCATVLENKQQERSGLAGMEARKPGVASEGTGGDGPCVFFDTGGMMTVVSETAFDESSGTFPKPVPASSITVNHYYNVPRLSAKERKERIQKYIQKRSRRNWSRSIKYACRKTIADNRAREHGRFIRNRGFGETRRSSFSNDTFEDGEFEDLGTEEVSERVERRRS